MADSLENNKEIEMPVFLKGVGEGMIMNEQE